ncbi:hypothetical protein BV22DRAFT_1135303 [Leucogyrophana mollusca]|uniref:Uncharacterized protein n=1 Tax=Leucogyrophana mollusca TaxID=85980 RepID=A0ACB8AWD0_9AGAM|nr:hypothetical protein BV22DRAFT_1135303 [Leucogyrophana mollusca]
MRPPKTPEGLYNADNEEEEVNADKQPSPSADDACIQPHVESARDIPRSPHGEIARGTTRSATVCIPSCCVMLVAQTVVHLLSLPENASVFSEAVRQALATDAEGSLRPQQPKRALRNPLTPRYYYCEWGGVKHRYRPVSSCFPSRAQNRNSNLHLSNHMARPTIHKTLEAKQQAARTKRRAYYARHKDIINAKRRKPCQPETRKQQREALEVELVGSDVEKDLSDSGDDISFFSLMFSLIDSDTMTVGDCLAIVKDAKDELIALTGAPRTYITCILHEFVATMNPENADSPDEDIDGDLKVFKDAIAQVEKIHEKGHRGQDRIYEMCGYCVEWKAADEICRGIRNVIAMIEDLYCLAMSGDLAEAHMLDSEHRNNISEYFSEFLKKHIKL